MVKWNLDGAVDKSSAHQEIYKSDAIVQTQLVKNLEACT